MSAPVRRAIDGGVATITLARPDAANALSVELLEALTELFDGAVADDRVRAIVLTNEGATFCAGMDLKAPEESTAATAALTAVLARILDAPKPVIGRIAGHCMGGGVGLAAACDISVVSDAARFGFTEVRIGVAPAIVSVVCLPKLRRADALELFLGGERIDASRAAAVGLVNQVVPADRLDEAVGDVVAKVLAGGPQALAAAKELVRRVPAMPRDEAFAWTTALSARLFASDEAAAGMAAFRARTPPPWVPPAD